MVSLDGGGVGDVAAVFIGGGSVSRMMIPLPFLLFPLLGLLFYRGCLGGSWIFDDHHIRESMDKWKWTWRHLRYRHRVVTLLSWAVQKEWPNTTRSLHVGNVVLHAVNALIVAKLASVLGYAYPELVGLIYLVHPFAVNTVAYMAGRPAILSTMGGLLTALLIFTGHPLYIPLSLAFAVLSKEDGVGFLPLAIVLLWIQGFRMESVLLVLGTAAVVAAFRSRWRMALKGNGDTQMGSFGLPVSLPQPKHAGVVLSLTLGRLPRWLVGRGTSPYYGSGIASNLDASYATVAVLWFLTTSEWFAIPNLMILAGPWLVYLLCPVPDQLFDYRNYSMIAGFALLLGLTPIPLVLLLIPILCWWTIQGAWAYQSPESFWTKAIATGIGDISRAHQDLGAHHKVANRLPEAEKHLREALTLNPRLAPAMDNLAWILFLTNRKPEAIALLEDCTLIHAPDYAPAWQALALFLEDRGELQAGYYMRAWTLDRRMVQSLNRAGLIYLRQRDPIQAHHCFIRATEQSPLVPDFRFNLAVCEKIMGLERMFKETVGEIQKVEAMVWITPEGKQFPLTSDMVPVTLGEKQHA